jgi:hypothetical protein
MFSALCGRNVLHCSAPSCVGLYYIYSRPQSFESFFLFFSPDEAAVIACSEPLTASVALIG